MLLSMTSVTKDFGAVRVLHGVDFDLKHGEIHALIGHNGAGKSTLMKVLGGNYAEFGGRVEIEGQALALHSPAEAIAAGVAMIYQDFALAQNLTVAENIALGREPAGRLPGTIDHGALGRRSAAEAELLGIDLPMAARVGRLGVAAQQLTEIVRAFSRPVRILVMDEPTARLAPAERAQLFDIMRRVARERNVGIVYISHFLEEVIELADRITILRDGRSVESGPRGSYDLQQISRLLVGHEIAEATTRSKRVPDARSAALSVEGLSYPGQAPVDLDLQPGEILGIAGLVGSGRTRLARALIGDLDSSGGTVTVAGRRLHRRSPTRAARAGLVMVPEDRKLNGLAGQASIAENIAATAMQTDPGFRHFGLLARIRALAERMIARFGIRPADPNRRVGTLSGGNAQKVLVARAVAARPKVMILDQPTAGVDIGAKAELSALLRLAAQDGAGVLLISDELEELIALSDRILVLAQGQLSQAPPVAGLTPASLLAAMSASAEAA